MLTVNKRPSKLSTSFKKGIRSKQTLSKDSSRRALNFLNFSQLLGALNDNVFKFLTIFLLLDLYGPGESSGILFWIGVVYVLPFLLFSSLGGTLADRFSKQKLIIYLKLSEVVIMALGILAYSYKSPTACYGLVFLMSAHSALFGPSKYSIIPELVSEDKISKANGLITSSTYLAIILGSMVATLLRQLSGNNFVMGAIACTLIALAGFICSLGIPPVEKQNQRKKMNPIVVQEIYRTLAYAKKSPLFLLAVLGSSFFLFIGAFIQLNIIPYAMNTLHLSDAGGGYLFSATSIGIVLGSYIGGKSTKGALTLGLSAIASLFISLFFLLLPIFSFSILMTAATLVLLGFSGGLFVVPLDSYIQTHAPKEKRGEIIACVNFLSFCGVLLAPILLYLLSGTLKLSNGIGFIVTGLINLTFFFVMMKRISAVFLYTVAKKLLYPFMNLAFYPLSFDIRKTHGLVTRYRGLIPLLLICGLSHKIHLTIITGKRSFLAFLLKPFSSIRLIESDTSALIPMVNFRNNLLSNHTETRLDCLVLTKGFLKKHEGTLELKVGLEKLKACCDFVTIESSLKMNFSFKKPWKLVQTAVKLNR
jgi:acyl-[acyl-carrier-protein]-phospholipid O-acyltransferase/long-chain-fatty-acid--[acyl-carrier-protein] ligase